MPAFRAIGAWGACRFLCAATDRAGESWHLECGMSTGHCCAWLIAFCRAARDVATRETGGTGLQPRRYSSRCAILPLPPGEGGVRVREKQGERLPGAPAMR
jgi:hypothetical protein